MKIKIQWTNFMDLIWIPDIIEKDLLKYQDDFLRWISGVSFDEKIKKVHVLEQNILFNI